MESREGQDLMRIALVQQRATDDKQKNVERGLGALERAVQGGAELVAYAELAFEPFYPQKRATGSVAELAEPVPGPTTLAFQERARELGVVVVLNLFKRDGDKTFDSSGH
jgi:N-carbamoylputrescine amidase